MKLILLMTLCLWNLTSQAAGQAFELRSQNKDHNFKVQKDALEKSLAFNGWYLARPDKNGSPDYFETPFMANGEDNLTITKFLMFNESGEAVEALFVKVDGNLLETQDSELIKSTLKEIIASRNKELETHIGRGEPEIYITEAGSCPASQAREAALLNKKVPHVVMRTGLMNVSYASVTKNAESFNCLSESEFIDWANKKVAVKPRSCGKENVFAAQSELRQVLDIIATIRGREITMVVSPVDFTQEMTGNW